MVLSTVKGFKTGIIVLAIGFSVQANADETKGNYIKAVIDQSFKTLMQQYDVLGMAVGVIYQGKNHEYYYGLQSQIDHKALDRQTIFELGSVSKIFTGIAGGLCQESGQAFF